MRALFLVLAVMLILALGSLEVLASRSASMTREPVAPISDPWE